MARRKPVCRIGTSGYQYDHWRGVFYPDELPKKRWFDHYQSQFDTVEINNTFYKLPDALTLDQWRQQVPDTFCYVLKYSRYGSHIKRLKDPQLHVDHFMDRAGRLGPTLGPILVQLPPHWHRNLERLDLFLAATPAPQRFAVEFRDQSWLCDETYDVLRRHNAALVVHDLIEKHPRIVTADWVYLRFHGPEAGEAYMGSYSPQALAGIARRIKGHLAEGRDVFAYFNNDAEGCAVRNALDLRRYVEY